VKAKYWPARTFLTLVFLSISCFAYSQVRCATVEYTQALQQKFPTLLQKESFERWFKNRSLQQQSFKQQRKQDEPYRIPVVVHVIHNGEAIGVGTNISDEQILSQIKVLNNDFQRLNSDTLLTPLDFESVAGNLNIEFVLALQDPEEQITTGIVRKQGSRTSWNQSTDVLLKSESYWPSENYMNIWVCNMSDLLGYAQFPVSDLEGLEDFQDELATTDGVVITYDAFGSVDDGDFDLIATFDKGRTLTHEVGHFFGLRHIWGDDNTFNGCNGTDYVDDTPNQNQETNGCPTHPRSSCSEVNMFQNYMDYTGDACMNLFTFNQADRMELILNDTQVPRRNSLLTSPALEYPIGFTNDVALKEITSPVPVSCGTSPTLTLYLQNRGPDPLTSVRVTYSLNEEILISSIETFEAVPTSAFAYISTPIQVSEGNHTLTVTVDSPNGNTDNGTSNGTLTKKIAINFPTETLPIRERFEGSFENSWSVISPYTESMWGKTSTFYDQSLFFTTVPEEHGESWLVSPVFNFTYLTEANLRFYWAYLPGNNNPASLNLKYTTDCGLSYKVLEEFSLDETTSSTPTGEDDWDSKVISLASLLGEANVRLAFVAFSSNNTNEIYLDNIEFFVGEASPKIPLDEMAAIYSSESGGITVTFNVDEKQSVSIQIFDLMGKVVLADVEEKILNQTFTYELRGVQTGIYIVRIKADNQYYSQKVFIPGR